MTLNRGFCFALLLGLSVVTQGQAENYYIYQATNGALVEPHRSTSPPGTTRTSSRLPCDPGLFIL
jgi:hypothetical protein